MRGSHVMQETLFTAMHLQRYVPSDHPLRTMRTPFDEALRKLNGLFKSIYANGDRNSIATEKLLRAAAASTLQHLQRCDSWWSN